MTPRLARLAISGVICSGYILLAAATVQSQNPQTSVHRMVTPNRAPIVPAKYASLPLGDIKANGWLKEQLERMASGMTGHLDEWYPTVGASNGWLGGDGDVWERGPYWLDGLVPLAYILQDKRLIDKAKPYIEWTLASQDESGFFGPVPESEGTVNTSQQQRTKAADWWPRMVMLKVLQQYHDATGDPRVIDFMTRYFQYQLKELDVTPLDHWSGWAGARGGENQASVIWLYNRTGEAFLLDLAEKLFKQTYNWTQNFASGIPSKDYWLTHVVNVAMAVKQPAQEYLRTGNREYLDAVYTGLGSLMEKHGQAVGMFSGDELLHQTDPVHGIELCAVVEFMLSLENLVAITGDVKLIDRLERITYNALPTQVTDDQKDRQYFQQVNQIRISEGDHGLFFDAYTDAICYGLLTGYPCCTTNLHQGWPKFVQSTWMATPDGGLAALAYAPSEVISTIGDGNRVHLKQETVYPMEDRIRISVLESADAPFPLHLRIPEWSTEAEVWVNGDVVELDGPGRMVVITRKWRNGDVIELFLPAKVELSRWHENGVAVHRGPLLYALPIASESRRVEAVNQPDGSAGSKTMLEAHPVAPWNYGLVFDRDHPETSFSFESTKSVANYFWNDQNVPLRLKAKGIRVDNWTEHQSAAGPMPPSPVLKRGAVPEEIVLIPYGATRLRVAVFPEVRN